MYNFNIYLNNLKMHFSSYTKKQKIMHFFIKLHLIFKIVLINYQNLFINKKNLILLIIKLKNKIRKINESKKFRNKNCKNEKKKSKNFKFQPKNQKNINFTTTKKN